MSYLLVNNFYLKEIYKIWLIVFFIIGPICLFAQTNRYNFQQLTPEEGLSQASNDFIYHDSKGFIWLSSLDGLNRYDGKSVKIYKSISGDSTSLLGNIITSNFFEDDHSNLWFTTYEGLHCYQRSRDNFKHFQFDNRNGISIKQDYYVFHLDNQGQLWVRVGVGKEGKVFLFDIKKNISKIICPIDGQRQKVIVDEENNVTKILSYFFQNKNGLDLIDVQSSFSKKSFFADNQEAPKSFHINHINIISENEWILGTDIGLVQFTPLSNDFKVFQSFSNQPLGNIRSTLKVDESTLWVTSDSHGLLIFDKNSNTFTGHISKETERKYGLHLSNVNKLFKDSFENIWITSATSGVNHTNLIKQKFVTPQEFINENINAIFENSEGEVFCSYGNSIGYYPKYKSELKSVNIQLPKNLRQQRVKFLFESDGHLWAITNSYVLKWEAKKSQFNYFQNLPSYILYVFKNKKGRILIATYDGILEWKRDNDIIQLNPFTALKNHQEKLATAIYEDEQERLYLALDASKLLILQPNGKSYSEVKTIEGIGYAKDFHETTTAIWIATSTGILKIDSKNLSSRILNQIKDGIPNEYFYSIIPDKNQNFWLSCNRGIIQYFPNESKHKRFSLLDGIQANEFNTNAFIKTRKGEIWMGGTKGINRFFPQSIQDIPFVPKIEITKLQVNDETFPTNQQIGVTDNLNLEHYNNTISFDFIALEYSDPKNNRLEYKLENHDEGWVDAGNNGFARYPNLPSGDYRFKIRAANSDGVWNQEVKQLSIHIQTPWWKTWWFYLACVLFISSLIFAVSRYQLQQALKIERMRVKISSDLHDDVGGLLAGLRMQTDLLKLKGPKELKPKLQRISELSNKAMSRMRDTVWAIDARKDKLENLLDRIREHALETLELKNIEFDLSVKGISLEKNMSSDVRQNIYLICKEAITNTAKHSNGDQLKISFEKINRNQILLTIKDNGRSKISNHTSSGLGMSNIKMRARQIGAQLEILPQKGYEIRLILKSDFKN